METEDSISMVTGVEQVGGAVKEKEVKEKQDDDGYY